MKYVVSLSPLTAARKTHNTQNRVMALMKHEIFICRGVVLVVFLFHTPSTVALPLQGAMIHETSGVVRSGRGTQHHVLQLIV